MLSNSAAVAEASQSAMSPAPTSTYDAAAAVTVRADVPVTVRPLSGFPFASFGVAASCTVWPACTDAVAGLTVTDATGTVLTVIVAVPPCPSLVAVIVAEPAVTPVTSPLPLTVATAVLLLAQLTARPDNGLPFASLGVAASCTVWPTCTDADAGLTATDATGTLVTVSAAVPLFPSLVAVSVAAPTATAVACPAPFTVATAGLLLDQVTVRPPSGSPNAARLLAAYCAVCPTPIVAVAGAPPTGAAGHGPPGPVTVTPV